MKLEDAERHYTVSSGKLSDIVRNLGLVGLAAVWFFKSNLSKGVPIPRLLLWVGVLLLVGLAVDAAQYLFSWVAWRDFHQAEGKRLWNEAWARTDKSLSHAERTRLALKERSEADLGAPPHINRTAERLLGLKVFAVTLGYVLLFIYVAPQL